ncbi:MAG: hypothetical protein SPK61_04175 [Bacteroidales bacterium]|nr:hypothetical protein [Bacteroidales bacterium]
MKHKLQTLLKHKLQWLLLLAALLGVSQGVWGATYPANTPVYVRSTTNYSAVAIHVWGGTASTSWPGQKMNYMGKSGSYYYWTYTFTGTFTNMIVTQNNDTKISGSADGSVSTGNCITVTGSSYNWSTQTISMCDFLSAPADVVSGAKVMYYIYQSYGGTLKVTNNTTTCITTNTTYTTIDNNNVYVLQSTGNVPANLRVTNNCGNWAGTGGFSGVTAANAAGAKFITGDSNSKTAATTLTASLSSSSITVGTASVNITYKGSKATSSGGSSLYMLVYVGSTKDGCQSVTTSNQTYTLNTSSLAAGTYTIKAILTDGSIYYTGQTMTLTVSSSCSTPSASDIEISSPSSATTLYLGTGSAPSVDQTVTATCSKGNTYLWSATPTTYTSSSCWSSTATRVAFTSASSKSTTATFYHEGVYTATFAAGCGNTTDASKNAPIITVKPGHIYFDGPFFSGSNYDLTKHHLEIDKSNDEFVYEWTATSSNTVATNDFIISVGNQCINATTSAYDIGNYADLTLNGLVIPDKDTSGNTNCNHNFRANIGTIAVGERLKLTISYTGVNSSGVPKYTVKLEKVCSNPTVQTVSGTATICDGSSTNVTVSSSQSNYTYKLYKGGSATSTTQAGTGSALNFSVSEAGAYTVHAYYTSGSDAYCTADMSGTATITVNEASVAGTISGGSSTLCSTAAKTLTLKNYKGSIQWHKSTTKNFTPSESTAISGATSATYSATPTTTTYYYKAVVTNGVCAPATTAQTSLLVRRAYRADDFTLSDNAQTYDGTAKAVTVALKANIDTTSTAGISTSIVTVYYTGTGTTTYAKSTTAPVNAGSYAVTIDVTKGSKPKYYCPATDISLGSDSIKKADQATLTISNTVTDFVYCDAANVKLTTSGGSGDGAVTYSVTSGSGSVDGDVLSPSAKGSVSVTATKTASQNYNATTSVAKTFNFNIDAPDVYTLSNVGETTTICGDPSSGAGSGTLRLSGSQTGYKYQLYSNGAPVEGSTAKPGTGSSIDFPVTSSGTYTVYAYYGDNSTNCPTLMDGEITLTISTKPRLVRSAAMVSQYTPVTVTCISTDIETWEVTNAGSTAYLYNQTYNSIDFKGASTNSPYTITATTKGGCSETTTITVSDDHEECN